MDRIRNAVFACAFSAALFSALFAALASPVAAQGYPPLSYPGCADLQSGDFRKVPIPVNPPASPTKMAIAKDGRMFFISLGGLVWTYEPDTKTTRTIATLQPVQGGVAFGLFGITLDPAFASDGWIYLAYSAKQTGTDVLQQLWRYPYADGKLDLANGKMLLQYLVNKAGHEDHSGGGMAWDAQGNLYLGTGDNAGSEQNYANVDETKEDYNSLKSAGNTNDLRGKILRIHPEPDGSYTIPDGNLFAKAANGGPGIAPGPAGTRPEIFVMGDRNPYTVQFDIPTGLLIWGEVGPQAAVFSADKGPAGMDEFNATRTAGNFGWPEFVGPNLAYNDFDYAKNATGPLFDSLAPVNHSALNTGLKQLPPARGSILAYGKDSSHNPWPGFYKGSAVPVTGPIYHYDGKNPSRVKLPPHLDGKWIVADAYQAWIRAITLDASFGKAVSVQTAFPGVSYGSPSGSVIGVLDMQLGPEGALYVLEYQSRAITRIEYAGTCLPDVASGLAPFKAPGAGPGAATGSFSVAPELGQGRRVALPAGKRGFALFDAGGKRVWDFERGGTQGNMNVTLPPRAGAGVLRGIWRK